MNRLICWATRTRTLLLAALAAAVAALAALPGAASAGSGPGTWTQADINTSINNALAYLDTQQNPDGSWGTTFPGAETALALGAYGVKGYANLSAAEQTRVQNGLNFLLGTQVSDGSFDHDNLKTYDTGTALIALSLLGDVPTTKDKPTAITNARNYLIANQQITANGASPCTPGGTSAQGGGWCAGWDYNTAAGDARSDESNTGFALTGLDLTGGVPPAVATANIGWQRNVQELTSNPGGFPGRNDGGGSYTPFNNSGDFSSNANDTGSLLFGFGYDGVASTDPAVQAAIKFGNDVLDVYETPGSKANRVMVFHNGMNEDGACDPAVISPPCDWAFGSDGGYHYSLFALTKGLSQYVAPSLTDATNFFAKVVDLLLSQQNLDGSWPADLRDDGSVIGATSFAVLALGRVGAPADPAITAAGTNVDATEGHSFSGTVATFSDPDTAATAGEYSATINWGDGQTSTGTVSGSGGSFSVSGGHTYAEEGSHSISVAITDTDNTPNTATASTHAAVADAPLSAHGVSKNTKAKFSGTIATFTDADPGGTTSDYTVTINWGDGKSSGGSASSGFHARGNHTFGKPGTYHVTVTIKDAGGSTTTATSTLTVTSLVAAHLKITGASATAVLAGCGTELVAFITVVLPDQSCTQGHLTVKGTIDKHARGHVHLKISSSVGNASGDAKISRGRWQATITVPGINKDPNPPTYTIDARFNGSSGVKKGSASKRVTLEVESASGVGPGLP